MVRRVRFTVPVVLVGFVLSACTSGGRSPRSPERPSPSITRGESPYRGLLASLRAAGFRVVDNGPVKQGFLGGRQRALSIDGGTLEVFVYGQGRTARTHASSVSEDGYTI